MPNGGTLYVFLHGLFVVTEQGAPPGFIDLVLPDIGDHVQQAGNWLSESDILLANLALTGVHTGAASFSNTDFTIRLPGLSLKPNPPNVAVTIRVPKPKSILGLLRAVYAPSTTTAGTPPAVAVHGAAVFSQIATLHVMVYDYDNELKVELTGHHWEPCSIGNAISLHVISTSEGPYGAAHGDETEQILQNMIQGYQKTILVNRPPVPSWDAPDANNFGNLTVSSKFPGCVTSGNDFAFSLAELEDIGARTARLNRLGRIKQEARPVGQLWHEPAPLGAEIENCWAINLP